MDSLTILGDFFEVWIGDDSLDAWSEKIFVTLKQLKIPINFIAGNRDFLLSEKLLKQFNIQLLPDNSVISFDNTSILLAHGDQLCTDDIKYQEFRKLVRSKAWQNDFLSKPLIERKAIVQTLRKQSLQAMKQKQEEIMDVNQEAVKKAFLNNRLNLIIHGHTHRENLHTYPKQQYRLVLGAWHNGIAYLKLDSEKGHLAMQLSPSNKSCVTQY